MEYLNHLNPQQLDGVLSTKGPTMIIAGAGSGKTRVLTYRIAYLIKEKDVDPFSILSLTFTNKAAKEMRHRIEQEIGLEARNIWMGTFHSVFARILRSEATLLGYQSNFTIYDSDDSKSLIKTIVKEMNLDDKIYKPNVVLGRISSAKNKLISWKRYQQDAFLQAEDQTSLKPLLGKIYQTYATRCFKASAMDFDDLLFNTNVLFRDHVEVLHKYQQRFHYVLVDEFQDTNYSQYLITKKLAAVRQNICVVGDDAQSIYAFRGADITNILNFEKDYQDLKVIKLEQNYRSTKNIVEAANSVINNNKAQLRKAVWTENEIGEKIEVIRANSDNEEGRLVASAIFEAKMTEQLQNREFAILYRTNSQSRSIEEGLRRMNLKYKIVGGLSFYSRKEIKDIISYLRFVTNHNDEQAFRRCINEPKRGIGTSTIDKIIVAAFDHDLSIWDVCQSAQQFLPGRAGNAVQNFSTMIKAFELEVQRKDAFEATKLIANHSGILKKLHEDKTVEGLNRYENVQELLNAIKEYVDSDENEDKSISAFLEQVALLSAIDSDKEEDDSITLMTIHSSKGLEFAHVFIVGLEEDLFPSQMMISSRADLEEERRLFYVAITRAKKQLYLSYALSRYRFGRLKTCEESRFLEEIDKQYLKMTKKFNTPVQQKRSFEYKPPTQARKLKSLRTLKPKVKHVPSTNFEASDTSGLAVGMKVEHPKFGFGRVNKLDVTGANRKAIIKFATEGEKTLLLSFAKLKIIPE